MKAISIATATLCVALLIGLSGCNSSGSTAGNGSSGLGGGGTTGSGGATAQNALLKGQYAFSFSGSAGNSTNSPGAPLVMAGSFMADGSGNISSGIEDLTEIGVVESKGIAVSGTYSIGDDGRGTLNFTSGVIQQFKIVLENGNHGQLIRFDSGATGSGTFDLQSASFSLSSLQGSYAFDWNGSDGTGAPLSGVGAFTLSAGTVNTGAVDLNDGGDVSQVLVTGSFQAPGANGHGTASITYGTTSPTTLTYGYDMISANRILLIETDGTNATVGEADLQSGTFTASSLSGNYAFSLSGFSTTGFLGLVGQIETSGGSVVSSDVTENNFGEIASGQSTNPGTYIFTPTVVSNVAVNGRFLLTVTDPSLGTDNFAVYMISPTQALVMEIDSDQLTSGQLLSQTGGSFSTASLSGNYGFNISGVDSNSVEADIEGQLASAGNATLTSGTIDINDEDFSPSTFATNAISGGMYSVTVSSTGHGTLTFTAAGGSFDFTFYFVSPNQVFLIETDEVLVSVGSALSQPAIPQ